MFKLIYLIPCLFLSGFICMALVDALGKVINQTLADRIGQFVFIVSVVLICVLRWL